jgi:hypothetical protein
MYFTEDDFRAVFAWALYRTSLSLGIIDVGETIAPKDAIDIISQSKGHKEALNELADAYGEWYSFHLEIYKAGKSGKLNPNETDKLNKLISRRAAARDALLAVTPV